MSIEQKLKNLDELSKNVDEADRVLKMRLGQYDDALKDLMTKDLGYKAENNKFDFRLHQLMKDVIRAAAK